MAKSKIPGMWQAKLKGGVWQVLSEDGQLIATLANIVDAKDKAKLIATSPYMLGALKAMVELIGDEDLPDNGELSGAAICDMARSAVAMATGHENWPFSDT